MERRSRVCEHCLINSLSHRYARSSRKLRVVVRRRRASSAYVVWSHEPVAGHLRSMSDPEPFAPCGLLAAAAQRPNFGLDAATRESGAGSWWLTPLHRSGLPESRTILGRAPGRHASPWHGPGDAWRIRTRTPPRNPYGAERGSLGGTSGSPTSDTRR